MTVGPYVINPSVSGARMAQEMWDLLVIGGGSAGVRCARTAASLGARVALAEMGPMGGTCVNLGCVPKKFLVYAARFQDAFDDAEGYGWSEVSPTHDWAHLVAQKDKELLRLNGIYEGLLERVGVVHLQGRATFKGPDTVEVNGQPHQARHVVIATGGRPYVPSFEGAEHALVSDAIFSLPERPRRLLIVGGGYIAVEFASVFAGLGSEVTLAYRGAQLLRAFDPDLGTHLQSSLEDRGIDVRLHTEVHRLDGSPEGPRTAHMTTSESLEVDAVLMATGRRPNTEGLGLEEAGVSVTKNGAVEVDAQFETRCPGVYAIGDVIGEQELTPVALAHGTALAHRLFGEQVLTGRHAYIPTAVFSIPEIATVGLSEPDARAAGHDVKIFRSVFRPMLHTLSGRSERTLMKLVVDRETDVVLGCHMVGPDAAEIIQGLAVALQCGATKAQFDGTLGIHPTAGEEFVTMRTEAKS